MVNNYVFTPKMQTFIAVTRQATTLLTSLIQVEKKQYTDKKKSVSVLKF